MGVNRKSYALWPLMVWVAAAGAVTPATSAPFELHGRGLSLERCLALLHQKYGIEYVVQLGATHPADVDIEADDYPALLSGLLDRYGVSGFPFGNLFLIDATRNGDDPGDYDAALKEFLPVTPTDEKRQREEQVSRKAREAMRARWSSLAQGQELPEETYAIHAEFVSNPAIVAWTHEQIPRLHRLSERPNHLYHWLSLADFEDQFPKAWLQIVSNNALYICIPTTYSTVTMSLGNLPYEQKDQGFASAQIEPGSGTFQLFFLTHNLRARRGADISGKVTVDLSRASMNELCAELSRQTGANIRWKGKRSVRVSACVRNIEAAAFLQCLTAATGFPWHPWWGAPEYSVGGNTTNPFDRALQAAPVRHRLWFLRNACRGEALTLARVIWNALSVDQRKSLAKGGRVPYTDLSPESVRWVRWAIENEAIFFVYRKIAALLTPKTSLNESNLVALCLGRGKQLLECRIILVDTNQILSLITSAKTEPTLDDARQQSRLLRATRFVSMWPRMYLNQPVVAGLDEIQPRYLWRRNNPVHHRVEVLYDPSARTPARQARAEDMSQPGRG